MKQYVNLVNDILKNGTEKKDRTGTGTKSIFGHQMRFKMSDGFPLLVLKKTHFKSIVTELLWFLKGDTNIQWLEQNDCSIWRDWPYKKYCEKHPNELSSKEFAEKIKTDDEFAKSFGDLGPVYGKQWVNWTAPFLDIQNVSEDRLYESGEFSIGPENRINQIQIAIDKLKTNPEDRGNVVSAWNVAELKYMALRPCHAFFQFDATEIPYEQRIRWFINNYYETGMEYRILLDTMKDENLDKLEWYGEIISIPKHKLSIQLYQRSCDTFLGVPFNIASYSLLLHMVAQCVNMVPHEFIWTGGDVHLYSNHIEQANELLKRWDNLPLKNTVIGTEKEEPVLPKIKLNSDVKDIFNFTHDDIVLENYNPMPSIKAPVAV